jgi:hypothetical protein
MSRKVNKRQKGQNDFNIIMFFICHVEKFIKILPFRTHNTDDKKKKRRGRRGREREMEVVKCRDEKKNTAMDQDGIKFHSLSTSLQHPTKNSQNTKFKCEQIFLFISLLKSFPSKKSSFSTLQTLAHRLVTKTVSTQIRQRGK